ncbi:hypothetical protein ACF09Y_36300 [Streptomyces massasporeus]|uniref:hypothetical protein n=1 Tax=Streptomyces massasporeus TaxID=67324 RepID=UPI0036FE709D
MCVNHLTWRHVHARRTPRASCRHPHRRPRRPHPRRDHPERGVRRRRSGPVCDFYLAAFNFDAGEKVNWTIQTHPEVPGGATRTGTFTADAGPTRAVDLPNGQYTLTWLTDQAHGAGKFKVFKVDCPTSKPTMPVGGPPAGGGGIARGEAFTPVTGAAAVGLAAVAGTVWFRLRRRPDAAA